MNELKTIFVTGATGNQGGAVTRHLLNKGFKVKALVRNPSKSKLAKHDNLEIIPGDLNEPNSYSKAFSNLDGVFANPTYTAGIEKEEKQGFALINSAKQYGVKHFVYSSVVGCDLQTGIPHWESKFRIENHLKSSGLNYTILRPSS